MKFHMYNSKGDNKKLIIIPFIEKNSKRS